MNFNWKHKAGAMALSVALLSMTATGPVEAKGKSATIPVELPTVDAPPSAEKGIKDQAVKGCGNCGVTGRVAAPPAAGDPAPPPPSAEWETGQLLDKGPRWPNKPLTTSETPPPVDDAAAPGSAEKVGRPKERDDSPHDTSATERRAHDGPGGTPPTSAAMKNKTGWIVPTLVGTVAAIAAVLASGNNDDSPASP